MAVNSSCISIAVSQMAINLFLKGTSFSLDGLLYVLMSGQSMKGLSVIWIASE